MYTLILKDSDKADKIKQSLPPSEFFAYTYTLPFLLRGSWSAERMGTNDVQPGTEGVVG